MANNVGKIIWVDLTVQHATAVRDFYQQVVGWKPDGMSMGDYEDYSMLATDGQGIAGVCHKRGENANIPSQWMIYIVVENLDRSLAACTSMGGKAVTPVREMGSSRMAVTEDPAGAVCVLWEQGQE